MFNQIGGLNAVGAPLPSNVVGGESFIRHIGNDKLIYDFKSGSGTVVKDRSREGNNGTFGAGASRPAWLRNSLYFNSGDYVTLTGINHGISTGGFTFCFSLDAFSAGDVVFDQETVRLYIYNTMDKIRLGDLTVTDTGISATKPICFQLTRDNSTNVECYINSKASNIGRTVNTDYTYDGISIVLLGAKYNDTLNIVGTMYSFRILNKGLSGIECQQEYLANRFGGNN